MINTIYIIYSVNIKKIKNCLQLKSKEVCIHIVSSYMDAASNFGYLSDPPTDSFGFPTSPDKR